MAQTFEFDDASRVERLTGTLHAPGATPGDVLTVNADKSVSPAPGGGSQPAVYAEYVNDVPVTLADGASAAMPWNTLFIGTELIDHTDPLNPVWLADGEYQINIIAYSDGPLTSGGYARLGATFGTDGGNGPGVNAFQDATHPENGMSVTAFAIPALVGDAINAFIINHDGGAASHDFMFEAIVVKTA